jgi:hypothetical protein
MNAIGILFVLVADAQLCLGPLILISLLALTHKRPQRGILLTAIMALALLLLGVALYDRVLWLGDVNYVEQATPATVDRLAVAFALLGIGGALSFAATVLALSRAAQTQRWGWFARLAIFLVLGAVASVAAYDRYSLVVWEVRFEGRPFVVIPAILRTHDVTRSPTYFILWSLAVVISPLMALLYGAIVREERAL